MDRRLFEAAVRGNVGELLELVQDDPLILHRISLESGETPIHVASMAGQLDFVKEIIRLKPEFARGLNQAGYRPLHIASANGYLEIVQELLKVNHDLCRMTSTEKRTALHYASVRGQIDIIRELVSNCAECVEDVTVRGETALHLAVKNKQFEAVRFMVETLKQFNDEDVLNRLDIQGNTILHLATSTKQHEVVELLLGNYGATVGMVQVNAINKSGLTALDLLLLFPSEAGDREIEEILRLAGAMRAHEIGSQVVCHTENITNNTASDSSQSPSVSLVEYFKFHKERDSPDDVRSALLVIAVLIAAATFQAGICPPGGVWQDSSNATAPKRIAGKAILSSTNVVSYSMFIFFNSLGFHLSVFIIHILTHGFPLRLELHICMAAMICTYNISASSLAPNGRLLIMFHVLSVVPLSTPFIARWMRLLLAKRRCVGFLTDRNQTSTA